MRHIRARTWMGLVWIALAIAGCTDAKNGTQGSPQVIAGAGGSAGTLAPAGGAGGAAGTQIMAGAGGVGGQAPAGTSGGSAGDVATTSGQGGAAGTMVAAGTGGAAGAEPMPDAGELPPDHEDLGMGDGQDVVTIGDSWMSYFLNGGGIEGALDRAGTDYRHYAVAGTTLGTSIPPQWDQAKAGGEVKTVIMTGGGNDIMFSGGCNTKAACEMAVQEIANMLDVLWTQMSDDGVQDVVYIQYSKNAGTAPAENRPATAPTPGICIRGPLRCHSMSTTELVAATDTVDGIHPTSAAADRIAAAVIELMETEGVRR
jgi:lysophospholipase L1-like esterase